MKKLNDIRSHLRKDYTLLEFECTRTKPKPGIHSAVIEITLT